MAASNYVNLHFELTGLGEQWQVPLTMSTTTTVTAKDHVYQTQAVADTAEALKLGGVTTPHLIVIKCITNDVDIDTSYSSSFSAEIKLQEGEFACFMPEGTVYIKNDDSSEQSVIEAWIIGV